MVTKRKYIALMQSQSEWGDRTHDKVFNFSRVNTLASQLDLTVAPSEKLNGPVGKTTTEVPRAKHHRCCRSRDKSVTNLRGRMLLL